MIFVTHDVQEAVFLAERIAIMSARPGHIKEIVEARFDKADPRLIRRRRLSRWSTMCGTWCAAKRCSRSAAATLTGGVPLFHG